MDKIDEILTRGVANIIPNKNDVAKALHSGKKLNIYLGIDPTAPRIHLGHAVPLRKLQRLAELGHKVTLLIGDFTALIGDTSDKDSERPILTPEQIAENIHTYKNQAEKLLDFSKIRIAYNSEWLKKLTYNEIIKIQQQFSLNDFISRELIRKRLDDGKRVRLDETSYPLMQGYDSYHLDTDIQLGATDQTFNMQAGRTLQKVLRNKESYIIANTYLEGTDGRKMSKSWRNAIWLDDTAEDMYAKVMAIKDELIVNYFTLATDLSLEQIDVIEEALKAGEHPMQLKKKLAFTIVSELHNKQAAEKAAETFTKVVQEKTLPEEISLIELFHENQTVSDILVQSGLSESKAEAKRLIEQGGVKINDKPATDWQQLFHEIATEKEILIQVGKRRFVKVSLKK